MGQDPFFAVSLGLHKPEGSAVLISQLLIYIFTDTLEASEDPIRIDCDITSFDR